MSFDTNSKSPPQAHPSLSARSSTQNHTSVPILGNYPRPHFCQLRIRSGEVANPGGRNRHADVSTGMSTPFSLSTSGSIRGSNSPPRRSPCSEEMVNLGIVPANGPLDRLLACQRRQLRVNAGPLQGIFVPERGLGSVADVRRHGNAPRMWQPAGQARAVFQTSDEALAGHAVCASRLAALSEASSSSEVWRRRLLLAQTDGVSSCPGRIDRRSPAEHRKYVLTCHRRRWGESHMTLSGLDKPPSPTKRDVR